ncbi:hypothetical protein [Aestuariirhabdus sp. LZHN29]|uniref:hypothetical protein n=1 Tax=Aestuariirhabdus sp. LZHN29 TaxID=3417462 RepID=UPI003CF3A3D4
MAHNNKQSTIKRCAIYSRSSVGKDDRDPFDSVSAQFMACAEFIGSQVGKGWRLVDTIYKNRGYSSSHVAAHPYGAAVAGSGVVSPQAARLNPLHGLNSTIGQ